MKTFNYTFGFKEIVTSLIINLLIEKDSSRGINSHIRVENWTDGNQTLSDITRGIFINIIRTTENNDIFYWREKRNISSAPKNIFYTLSTNAKIDVSVNKKFIPNVIISSKTCQDWISNYDGVNVFLFNLKAVILMNFKSIIIIKSLWRNWSHNRSVIKCINNNQYQNEIMKLELYCNLNKPCDCN